MLQKEIILHVGMHKTGTTSIQRAFDGYDDGCVQFANLKFPGAREANHGNAITTVFKPDYENIPFHKRNGRTRAQIGGYRKMYRAKLDQALSSGREKIIFSGEYLPRLRLRELIEFRDYLLSYADKITIVAFIREPHGFAESMFQQSCQLGHVTATSNLSFAGYKRKFKKFINVFGSQNIRFVKFDKAVMEQGSSVAEFAKIVGIDPPKTPVSVNQRLSMDATRLIYILLTECADQIARVNHIHPLRKTIDHLVEHLEGTKFTLPMAATQTPEVHEDVRWIERRAGFDLSPYRAQNHDAEFDLKAYMTAVDIDLCDRLAASLEQIGCAVPASDNPVDLMRALYLHLAKVERWKMAARKVTDLRVKLLSLVQRNG